MDCPSCNGEMTDLSGDDMVVRRCGECSGIWIDVADLNRVLLHNNLPVLQSLGGRMNVDAATGLCPDCQVDLVEVEGGERRSLHYDTCEVCGGVFIETAGAGASLEKTVGGIVDFYKRFGHRGAVA